MRPLEDHLSPQELASLPESPGALASGAPEQQPLLNHLAQCEACSSLVQTHWALRAMHTPAISDEVCPSQDTWLAFSAGLNPERSSLLLSHAAGCNDCALFLKEAMQLMQSGQLEEAHSKDLASATPAWQRNMAAQMMAATAPFGRFDEARSVHQLSILDRIRLHSKWILIPAAAAGLCVAMLVGMEAWRFAHPSEARLLAEAYNKQRTLALRIPGGDPVPMASGNRGGAVGLSDPTQLLELRLRAQRHLDETPNSPYWHQVMGEVNLLEQNGQAARRNFEIAQTTGEDLPNLKIDLAAAWFEIGDQSGNAESYAEAAELYLRELHKLDSDHAHGSNLAILHYNLALCWERQNLNALALEELRTSVSLERSASWRAAIQAEIDRLTTHASTTPKGDTYEADLKDVTTNSLSRWKDDLTVRARILKTASSGIGHHDHWLVDWVSLPHTIKSIEADRHLGAAQLAAARGAAEVSLAEATQAKTLYASAHNRPGMLMAMYDEIYAYQRLTRTSACISAATALEADPGAQSYPSLRFQAQLDHAICANFEGDYSNAEKLLFPVQSQAPLFGLLQLDLRARSMYAALLHNTGRTSAAWEGDVIGLALCAKAPCTATRQYSFLYDLMRDARDLGLRFTAEAIMHSAVDLADRSDVVTRAYAYERLGLVAGQVGDFAASQKAFAQAYKLANEGNQAALSAIYQADWAIDEAEILCRQGQPDTAHNLLQRAAPTMLGSDYVIGRIAFLRQASVVEGSLGHIEQAIQHAQRAVNEAELSRASVRSTAAREAWAREHEPLYVQLVKSYISAGDTTKALEIWEHFRSLGYAPGDGAPAVSLASISAPSNAQVLIVAKLDDTYYGWLAAGRPLHVSRSVSLGDTAHLQDLATLFYRLCADRDSSLSDVHATGAILFTKLLEPLTGNVLSTHLMLDLDSSIEMIPISALTTPNMHWLGSSAEVSILAPWWSLNRGTFFGQPSIRAEMSILIVNGFEPIPGEETEASTIAALFHHAISLKGSALSTASLLRQLGDSGVFHFSGHTTASFPTSTVALSNSMPGAPALLTPDSLEGQHLSRTQLAVLAACNTTAADPDRMEKLPDLRNSLMLAGTRNVVASNWDVNDHITTTLMLDFYRAVLAGHAVSQSLQIAQNSLNTVEQWQHPYYWAGFELFTS